MKISILNSTLSCITKCIGFSLRVINKKIIFGLFLAGFLGACGAPTAMLGPAYTLTSTGSVAQAGLSYGSNHLIMSLVKFFYPYYQQTAYHKVLIS